MGLLATGSSGEVPIEIHRTRSKVDLRSVQHFTLERELSVSGDIFLSGLSMRSLLSSHDASFGNFSRETRFPSRNRSAKLSSDAITPGRTRENLPLPSLSHEFFKRNVQS